MHNYQFPSQYPHQSRLADHDPFVHGSPPLDPYSKVGHSNHPILVVSCGKLNVQSWQMAEGLISSSRHGGAHQVYASPVAMDPMPMLLYPGASPAPPQYSNPGQYTYDNLRTSPILDNNYLTVSPHYEVFPSNSSRPMDFGVCIHSFTFFIRFRLNPVDTFAGRSSHCETTEVQ